MKKKILALILSALMILQVVLIVGCNTINGETFMLPEIKYSTYNNADFSDYTPEEQKDDSNIPDQWENYGIGDPFVMRYNGVYYMYCSSRDGMRGVRGWKSYDMVTWTKCTAPAYAGEHDGYVSWDDCLIGAFAPEVYHFNGKFYMYTSPSGNGHYILEADSPEGPFVRVSDNIGMSIDGSVFIDDDESMYFLNAGASGIVIREMESMSKMSSKTAVLQQSTIGSWTEGPMIIKRDGVYYLTYTGSDVESQSYRISYNTEYDGAELLNRDAFSQRGVDLPIILTVDEENNFKGLGHSSTVMGPDMDSYYIVYHSLNQLTTNGPYRSMNIDRLIFNGTQMSVDESKTNSITATQPAFYAQNTLEEGKFTTSGNTVLSSATTGSVFSAEFNFTGDGVKCIVGYVDQNNYSYVETDYANNAINLYKVSQGTATKVAEGVLKNDFDENVLHTVRVAYAEGKMDVFFDNMCKISNAEISVSAGKIGYDGTGTYYCTTFSNVAKGLSDRVELKQSGASIGSSNYLPENYFEGITSYSLGRRSSLDKVVIDQDLYYNDISYTNAYQLTLGTTGDFARYLTYFREGGHYGLKLTYDKQYAGSQIGVQVNGGEIQTVTLPSYDIEETYTIITTFVAEIDVEAGENIISLHSVKGKTAFISFSMEAKAFGDFSFENSLENIMEDGATYATMFRLSDGGHATREGSRMLVYIGDDTLSNYEVEVKIKFLARPAYSAGIVLRARNFANARNDGLQAISAYYISLKSDNISVSKLDHGYSESDIFYDAHGRSESALLSNYFTLRVVANGNTLAVYLDGQHIVTITDAHPFLTGHFGLYSEGAEVVYKDLKITANK